MLAQLMMLMVSIILTPIHVGALVMPSRHYSTAWTGRATTGLTITPASHYQSPFREDRPLKSSKYESEGIPSLWHSTRVALASPWRFQQARVFRLAAYGRAVPGLFQNTIHYRNTTVLVNAMIGSCSFSFTWTSLSLQCKMIALTQAETA